MKEAPPKEAEGTLASECGLRAAGRIVTDLLGGAKGQGGEHGITSTMY